MSEKPILFSAPMVRAVLAGTKTQTRRVVKPQPENDPAKHHPIVPYNNGRGGWNWVLEATGHGTGDPFPCPYGKPGDRLWVREAFGVQADCTVGYERFTRLKLTPSAKERPTIHYRADASERAWVERWRPSIHMPRWASRITLEVTGVRVERLQAISATDAIAEGVNVYADHHGKPRDSIYSPVQAYRDLWEQINGPGSWEANPFVWVVEFRRLPTNQRESEWGKR